MSGGTAGEQALNRRAGFALETLGVVSLLPPEGRRHLVGVCRAARTERSCGPSGLQARRQEVLRSPCLAWSSLCFIPFGVAKLFGKDLFECCVLPPLYYELLRAAFHTWAKLKGEA